LESSLRIGPQPATMKHSRNVFCSRCCRRLYLPRVLERKAWQQWADQFRAESPQVTWAAELLARIDAGFASAGWYTPLTIDPGAVECPVCALPMTEGRPDGDPLACPACGSLNPAPSGFTGHASLAVGDDGFA
jgi:hypothetical protein